MPKWAILASFWKSEVCGQTVLPDRSLLIGQKFAENAKFEKFICDFLGNFQSLCWWPKTNEWQPRLLLFSWFNQSCQSPTKWSLPSFQYLLNGVPRKGVARQSGLVCDTTRDWEKWSQAQVSIVTVGSTEEFLPFYDLLMAKRSPSEMIWRTLWSAFWPFENSPPWKVLSSNCSRKTKTIFQLSKNERIFKIFSKKWGKFQT